MATINALEERDNSLVAALRPAIRPLRNRKGIEKKASVALDLDIHKVEFRLRFRDAESS
jgi:hypothetical protein